MVGERRKISLSVNLSLCYVYFRLKTLYNKEQALRIASMRKYGFYRMCVLFEVPGK